MAHRLPRTLRPSFILATALLLTAAQSSNAQPVVPPFQPPPAPPLPKQAEPAVKELSKQEIDGLIEKVFGRDCAELKRPIRMWFPNIGMVLGAEEASVVPGHFAVRFKAASAGFPSTKLDIKCLCGEEIVVAVDEPVIVASEVRSRRITRLEVRDKETVTILTQVNRILHGTAGEGAIRFKFNIDGTAPPADLLPPPVKASAKLPHWTNEDLARVPEVEFGEPVPKKLDKIKAMEATAHLMAKINHLNAKKTDGFMEALIANRPDLNGLPFLMGDECRTGEEQAKDFATVANFTHRSRLPPGSFAFAGSLLLPDASLKKFTEIQSIVHTDQASVAISILDNRYRAITSALMQIFSPEPKHLRVGLVQRLATIPHADATKALAKLAIFSAEDDVRLEAIEKLKSRNAKDYTEILLQGFRYPLPAVSKQAADALVKLERKDLLENLVQVLEFPDPRLPVTEKRDGKEITFVRELVKINHHRNCLLCHAPGNTEDTPSGVLKVAVPLPNEPLSTPSAGGYQFTPPPSPDVVVRIDMTYLRQDFSLLMPVKNAKPWPDMQRFDFVVRTRTLTPAEAQAYEPCCEADESGRLSPYHRAALFALRELTGRDTEPTAAAWRKLLRFEPPQEWWTPR